MATQASIGHGVLFKVGNGASPEVFTTVAEVTSFKFPNLSRDPIEATHSESTEGWKEFIPGLKDGGEFGLELNFVPGSSTTLLMMSEMAAAAGNKQVVFTGGQIWSFAAFATGLESDGPVADKMTASVTYKITGKPTLA